MRKEKEIFTQINAKNVPVNPDILDSLEQEDMTESILRGYIRELLTETSELPSEYFTAIDNAISSSQFWTEPNSQDDIDEYSSPSGSVMGSPAAEALSQSLHKAMQDVDLDIDVLIRSHYTDDLEGMTLHPSHPAWPDRWLVDAKWYLSLIHI